MTQYFAKTLMDIEDELGKKDLPMSQPHLKYSPFPKYFAGFSSTSQYICTFETEYILVSKPLSHITTKDEVRFIAVID